LKYAFTAGRLAEPAFHHVWPRLIAEEDDKAPGFVSTGG